MGRKLALIIGNSQYEDAGLSRLPATQVDIRELAEVLVAPDIGQFDDVTQLADQGLAAVRRAIARFFTESKKDDLLVLYFSGHGVKDEQGHLYLAVKDTERHLLAGTGIETPFITAQMDRSYARRQVLILDCCHSGAFAYGAKSADMDSVGTGPAFEGRGNGRVVLTATDAVQYAWQGDQVIGESETSVFTHYLLQGLRTGEADRDGDGFISLDELYDYVHENVVRETPKQTPGKWTYRQEGEIIVAKNRVVRPADLPLELRALVDSPFPRLRAEAVPELVVLLTGHHPGLVLAARTALEQLRADDSRRVSAAAEAALTAGAQRAPVRDTTKKDDEAQTKIEALLARNEFERAEQAIDEAEKESGAVERLAALRDRLQRARAEALEAAETERKAVEAREREDQVLVVQKLALAQEAAERTRREEAKKRAEAERIAREREVAAALKRTREHMARREFVEALAALDHVRRLDAKAAGLAELTHAAEAGRAAVEEAERIRRDEEAALAEAAVPTSGDLAGALERVEHALQLDPDNRAAVTLRRQLQASIEERRRTEETQRQAREREQKVTALIARSKAAATHQAAIEILEGALALDPEHQRARQALAERTQAREQEAAERVRQQALAAARTRVEDLLERGELDQAERAVAQGEKECGEPAAFDDLRQRLRSALRERQAENERIDRLRRQEEAKKRAEAERIAREREVGALLRRAREHMARREFVEALAALDQVRRLDVEAAGLAELTHAAEAGRTLAEEAERVRRDVDAMLAEAAGQTKQGDLVAALEHVEHALQLDPDNRAAVTLRRQLQASIEERRRTEETQRQAREREQKVTALIARSKAAATHQAAIEILEGALALDPEHPRARQALAERTQAREQEAAERVRQQALAAARTRVEDLFERGELDQAERAVAQGEKECGEPAAFDDLRQRLRSALRERQAENERIDRLRRQEEAKKRAEAERIAREREVTASLERAREHMARNEFVEALAALDQVRRLDAEAAGLAELTHAAEAGRVAAAEAEKRFHDSRRRLAAASWRFRRWDVLGALTVVEEALQLDPQNQQAAALRDEIQHEIDRGVTDWRSAAASVITASKQSVRSSRIVQLGLVVLLAVGIVLYRVAPRNEPVTVNPTTGPVPISEGAKPVPIPLATPAPPANPAGRAAAGPVASPPTPAGRSASPTGGRSRSQGPASGSRGSVTAAPAVPSVAPRPIAPSAARGSSVAAPGTIAPIPIAPSAGRGSSTATPGTTTVETGPSNAPGAASTVAPTPVGAPAPAPPLSTAPRPPPVSPTFRDQQAIRGLLQAYEAAYDRKDVAGVESIWPAMGRILRGQLPLLNSVDLTLAIGEIKVDGDTASVSLRQDWYYDWKRAGMAPATSRGSMVLSLRRRGDSWVVVDDRGR